MAARKAWRDLSPSYRARLERAGITARSHRSADVREARGHAPPPRPGQAPADVAGVTLPTDAQRLSLRAWRETLAPAWLPSRQNMSDATAASLSALKSPSTWRSVDLYPAASGQGWEMRVTYTRGYPQTITLPPDQHRDVLDLLSLVRRDELGRPYTGDDAAWSDWVDRGRDFDVHPTT